jgi:hypothetical protein
MVHVIGLHRSTPKLFSHHLSPLFRSKGFEYADHFETSSVKLSVEEPKLRVVVPSPAPSPF